jgi:uncharacterized protein YbjT (DUF2867 family)
MNPGKIAFVFGASGLVGSHVIKELTTNPVYNKIFAVVRKPLVILDPKVQEIILDTFETFDLSGILAADAHVFCCVGTTIKKAGTQEEFRKADYELPIRIAKWAMSKGMLTFVVISSIGAKATSGNFYLRTKGEMEEGLKAMHFPHLIIVRPSLLLGKRNEFRLGEEAARAFSGLMNLLFWGPLKKYRAIHASTVARAMVILANSSQKQVIFESDKLQVIAGS